MTAKAKLLRLFSMLAAAAICSAVLAPAAQADVKRVRVPSGFVMVENVNVRNGNFALTFGAFGNGTGAPYDRTYNSKSMNRGVFGLGWGSPFDTRLVVMGDGTIAVRENGNGSRTVYGSASADATAAAATEIAETVRALSPGDYRKDLAERLAKSPLLRLETIAKFGIKFDPPTDILTIDPRTTFVGSEDSCADARVVFAPPKDGQAGVFVRERCNGDLDAFNADGSPRIFGLKHGVAIQRKDDGRIERVDGGGGHALTFAHAPQQLTVTDEAGHANVYRFDPRGRNIALVSPEMGLVTFAYDERSNLTRIGFVDTTSIAITYNKDDQATSVKDRQGKVTTFEYLQTAADYETVVRRPGDDTTIYVMAKD